MFFLRKNMSIFGSEAGGKNKKIKNWIRKEGGKTSSKYVYSLCMFCMNIG